MALKREVSILTQENNHLRQLVDLASEPGLQGHNNVSGNGDNSDDDSDDDDNDDDPGAGYPVVPAAGPAGGPGTELQQLMVAGFGHYVDGRGERRACLYCVREINAEL